MNIFNIKWLRRLLLTSIYMLGVLGIVGSGSGGGGDDCFPFFPAPGSCGPLVFPPPGPPPSLPPIVASVNSSDLALDGSDDIYVGGSFTSFNGTAVGNIARLNNDGSLDTGFVTGTGFFGRVDIIASAIDASDDVYAGGLFSSYNGTGVRNIARLNNDGSLDTGFVTGTGFNLTVKTIVPAIDGSGDIYVGGVFTSYNGTAVGYIARLNIDGTLDAGFDTGLGFSNFVNIIAPAIDGSGDIYVGGEFTGFNGTGFLSRLIRLNDDGSLDVGFVSPSGWGKLDVAPATDGSGDVYVTRDSSPFLARLNDDGSIDAGFDTSLSGFTSYQKDITVATDGSGDIYAAGFFTGNIGDTNGLARLNSDGSLDAGFVSDAGFVGCCKYITPAIDGSNDIYIRGHIAGDIVRLNDNGSIDTGFDTGPDGFAAD